MFNEHVQMLVFHFITKENWLIRIGEERPGLPCPLMPTPRHWVTGSLSTIVDGI